MWNVEFWCFKLGRILFHGSLWVPCSLWGNAAIHWRGKAHIFMPCLETNKSCPRGRDETRVESARCSAHGCTWYSKVLGLSVSHQFSWLQGRLEAKLSPPIRPVGPFIWRQMLKGWLTTIKRDKHWEVQSIMINHDKSLALGEYEQSLVIKLKVVHD